MDSISHNMARNLPERVCQDRPPFAQCGLFIRKQPQRELGNHGWKCHRMGPFTNQIVYEWKIDDESIHTEGDAG